MATEARVGDASVGDADAAGAGRGKQLRVLPPAANWYCSQVCDWGYDARNARWLVVYGAKNGICIYAFDLDVTPPVTQAKAPSPDAFDRALRRPLRTNFVALLPRGKKDGRVTALRCIRDAEGELRVVCAGEEGAVQVWDPVLLTRVDQHRKHNSTEVTAVGVRSELDPSWIVAGDKQGVVSLWQRGGPAVQTFSPLPRDAVFSMDISPFDKKFVAVGYRSGAVCIINAVDKNIQYRLDGHDLEVQSTVWASISTATGSPIDYLATASRDRSIKVWAFPHERTDDEVSQEPHLAARLEIRKPQQASSHSQSTRLWLPLAWTYDNSDGCKYGLWTGSFEGNLHLYQWNGSPSGTIKPSVIVKNGHNRLLFGIASLQGSNSMPPSTESTASRLPSLMATISLDREIRVWSEDLTDKSTGVLTCVERIPAQGGFTYSLDFNSPRRLLACGVGDQTIRIWNLTAKQAGGGYQSELVWKGLQSKVTCVRWHPLEDHLLAFGTEDGRVGLWDLRNKSAKRLKMKHVGEIHQLEWTVRSQETASSDSASSFQEAMKALEEAQAHGKSLEDAMAEQKNVGCQSSRGDVVITLWSCDRSGLLCRTDVDKDASQQVRKDCSAFAWDTPNSTLSVGLASGKIEIMTHSESTSTTKKDHGLTARSSIFEHKESVTTVSWGNTGTTGGVLLASGTKSGEIIVYEGVGTASTSTRRLDHFPGYGESVVAVFRSHSGTVNCLRWNPNADNRMLASCGDDGAIRVWDIAHRALRSSFSLHVNRVFSINWISSTVISSCGQDQTIRVWDYEDFISTDSDEAVRSPQVHIAKPKALAPAAPAAQVNADILKTATPKPRGKKSSKGETMFTKPVVDWIAPSDASVGPLHGVSSNPIVHEATRRGIAEERKLLEQDGKIDEAAHLYLLEGRIAESLRLIASHGLLTSSWVSYAPMAGQDVWREVALLYATQLKTSGDYKSAALQYLSVSRVESAVECFVDGGMYSEAISLIASRLGSSHPLFRTTMWRYAQKLEKKSKFNEAASVYLSIGSAEANVRAITVLGLSANIEHVRRAMLVWKQWREASVDAAQDETIDENDGAMPSALFVSICGLALAHSDFALASRAISGLLHRTGLPTSHTVSSSPQRVLYSLSHSLLCVASTLHSGTMEDCSSDRLSLENSDRKVLETREFIQALHTSSIEKWRCLLQLKSDHSESVPHSSGFWWYALAVCRENGLWFEGSALVPEDVVEQLGDAAVFDYMLSNATSSDTKSSSLRALLACSRLILKLLAELMSGYLLSALEVLRELLLMLVSSPDDQLATVQLLFPGGVFDPVSPPLFGELSDEEDDTRALWAECCLLQCELASRLARKNIEKSNDREETINRLSSYSTKIMQLPALPEGLTARARALHEHILAIPHGLSFQSQEVDGVVRTDDGGGGDTTFKQE